MISTSSPHSAELPVGRAPAPRLDELERAIADGFESAGALALLLVQVQKTRDLAIEIGHRNTGAVLDKVYERIGDCLRPVDRMIRLAGGEFAIVLPGLRNHAQPLMAANKIKRATEEPVTVGDLAVNIRLSCGLAAAPRDADTPETLLVCAETALRHALQNHAALSNYPEIDLRAMPNALGLERSLRGALEQNELVSSYLPIIDIESGDLVAAEMLPRWHCRTFGDISPEVFIPIAEQADLLTPLTMWGFNAALRECMDWQTALPGLSVTLNLSPRVLAEPYIAEQFMRSIRVWGADPSQLTLEISEQSLMANSRTVHAVINELHAAGIRIAIDDFGAGYSSFSYLKDLPISMLKIDRSFVRCMLQNTADRRIVKSVIDLAHNFEMAVVANGVEDEETLDALTLMGCQRAQGHAIAEPLAATALADWLGGSPWTLRSLRRGHTLR